MNNDTTTEATLHETIHSTGTQKYTKPTLINHLIAHIFNARKVFNIKSTWHSGPQGLEFDSRFPRYVSDIAKQIDIKYSTNQSREYQWARNRPPQHEPFYNNGKDNCGDWPSRKYQDNSLDLDEEAQARSWMIAFDYMLRDAAITYTAMLRDTDASDDERHWLTSIIIELWDWHAKYEQESERHHRQKVEVKSWFMEFLWERGKVSTDMVNAPGTAQHGKVHVVLELNTWGNVHAYGDTLPEAIETLWREIYKQEEGKKRASK